MAFITHAPPASQMSLTRWASATVVTLGSLFTSPAAKYLEPSTC